MAGPPPEDERQKQVKRSALSNIFWFSSSNYFRQGVMLVPALLRPKLLSPELYGLFNLLRLIPTYAQKLHLGARTTMLWKVPQYESQGRHEDIRTLDGTVMRLAITLNIAVALILCAVAVVYTSAAPTVRYGLALAALWISVESYYDHFIARNKGRQNFKLIAQCNYIFSIAMALSTVGLLLLFGFFGAMLAPTITVCCTLAFLAWRSDVKPVNTFDRKVAVKAVQIGGPTLVYDVLLSLVRNLDKLLISTFLGLTELGYYALGGMIIGLLINVPGAAREVMETKMFESLRTTSNHELSTRYLLKPLLGVSLVMAALIGPGVMVLPVAIPWVLPEYTKGVAAMQYLSVGCFFLSASYPLRGIIVAFERQLQALYVLGAVCLFHASLSTVLIKLGFGIEGVAVSAGLGFFLMQSSLYLLALKSLQLRPRKRKRDLALPYTPFLFLIVVLPALTMLSARLTAQHGLPDYAATALMIAVYLLLLGAFYLVLKSRVRYL